MPVDTDDLRNLRFRQTKPDYDDACLLLEAADEIDRLRAELAAIYALTQGPRTQDQMAAVRNRLRKALPPEATPTDTLTWLAKKMEDGL